MSRYHTQYVFFSPVGGVEGGEYGNEDWKLHKNTKGYFPGRVGKGTQVHVRGSLYGDRGTHPRASAGLGLCGLTPSPPAREVAGTRQPGLLTGRSADQQNGP